MLLHQHPSPPCVKSYCQYHQLALLVLCPAVLLPTLQSLTLLLWSMAHRVAIARPNNRPVIHTVTE